jgi:hypothetical protein
LAFHFETFFGACELLEPVLLGEAIRDHRTGGTVVVPLVAL